MKTKLLVGIALIIAMFLFGNVYILGLTSSSFIFYYSILTFLCAGSIFLLIHKSIDKSSLLFFIPILVILAVSVILMAIGTKAYLSSISERDELSFEIQNLDQKLNYSIAYLNYLDLVYNSTHTRSLLLQEQVSKLHQEIDQEQTNSISSNEYRRNEREEDEDD